MIEVRLMSMIDTSPALSRYGSKDNEDAAATRIRAIQTRLLRRLLSGAIHQPQYLSQQICNIPDESIE
jgi:hypothetical protein